MSVVCINNLSPGVMISAINSVAYNAFKNHKTGEQFTVEEQKKIYEDLIKAIQEDFYDGNMSDIFTPMMADRNLGNKTSHIVQEKALIAMLMELQNSLITLDNLSSRAKVAADTYIFPKVPTELHYEIFNKFITKPKPASLPAQTEGDVEAYDTPLETPKFKDIDTGSALIKKALGELGEEHMTPILANLKDVVSKTWVDPVVRADGTARGFAGLKNVANTVKARLQSKIYDYLASRSNGVFEADKGRENVKYIFFTPGRVPFGFVSATKDKEAPVQIGEHADFKTMATLNGHSKVRIVIAEDLAKATQAVTELDPNATIKNVKENNSTVDDFIETSFTNPVTLSEEDLPVYYAHMLTSGENYATFLGAEYPSLGEAYRPKHKTSYAEPGTVNGTDQDSASLKIHKHATPRLIMVSDTEIVMDREDPYLDDGDFCLVSPILSNLASDMPTMARQLREAMHTNESTHKKNILASIYYRFFHPEDYEVLDVNGNPIKMRSYVGLEASQKMKSATVADYLSAKRAGSSLESFNSKLQSSVSALVTSFRSIKPNDQFGSRNNRGDKSNITGIGKGIWQFNTDFIYSTATTSVTGTITKDKYFKNKRVVVSKATSAGPNGEPRFNITVNKVDPKISDSTEVPGITYLVQVNFAKTEAGQPLEFQAGIPLTIIDRNTDATTDVVADIFAGFNFPTILTSKFYRPALLNSLAHAELDNENNLGTIETKSGKTVDVTLDNLYINMLFTMLLNGNSKLEPVSAMFSLVTFPSPMEDANIAYNPIDVMYGYRDMLSDIILHTEGELGFRGSQTYEGNKVAEYIQTSYFKLTSKLAKIPTRLNQGNVLTTGEYTISEETYGDKGKKLGDKTKSVESETENEKAVKAIEDAFIQEAAKSRDHNTVLIKIGAQSDRLHPQFHQFTATSPNGIFLREAEHGDLDTKTLARKALYVQQNYYANLNVVALTEWNKALGTSFKTLQEVATELKTNNELYLYSTIKADSELVNSSMITFEEVGEGKVKYARVPEDVLQSIAVFSDEALGLDYIETMRKMFRKQLESIGYTSISQASTRDVLEKIMGMSMKSVSNPTEAATNIAFDAYFYNSQILGVSALNLHSGGVAQYDHKSRSNPFFSTKQSFTDGVLNVASVIAQAKALKVPGSKLTLGAISVEELMDLRAQSQEAGPLKDSEFKLDRLAYIKVILENNTAFSGDEAKAKAMILNDMTRHLNDKFVSQVKRNQVHGTAMQLPRIVGTNEPGFLLGKSSKNITVEDDRPNVNVLGTSGEEEVKATDGVQMFHPLHSIRVNNSLGNDESSFRYDGVAFKDLTTDRDENGSILSQKKASFGSFDDDLNRKGSTLIDQTLERMGTAITFKSKLMLVPVKGRTEWKEITPEQWLNNGLALGWLMHRTPAGDAMIHSSKLLAQIKSNPETRQLIEQQIIAKEYLTDKKERSFLNVQELWEYFGATTNPKGWNMVGEIIGYHSGFGTKQFDLSDANYPNRDAFIEKVGYISQEKTGSKNVISFNNLLDPDFKFSEVRGNKQVNRWLEVSNEHHGYILQAEHNYDTTAPRTGLYSDDNEEQKANQVSLITQIISAASAEGMSIREANNINDTIGTLSDAALEGLYSKIADMTIKEHPKTLADKKKILMEQLSKGIDKNNTDSLYVNELADGAQEYARQLVARSLAKKDNDTGLASELLVLQRKASLTFDQKQLLPLFQSQLFNDFNKKTVRMKMPGGQFVVSPSHAFMPSYDLHLPHPSGNGDNGNLLLSGLNREDMNRMFYGPTFDNLSNLQKSAIDHSFPLAPITDLRSVKLSDIIVKYDGSVSVFNTVKQGFKAEYDADKMPEVSFNQFLLDKLKENNYQFRFGAITRKTEEKNGLKWAQWTRFDETGNEINILDTPEFRAYNEIVPIGKDYLKGKTASQHFKLPAIAPVSTKKQTKAKQHARSAEVINAIKERVPLGLIREYYFGNVYASTKELAEPTRMILPVQEAEFSAWLGSQDLVAVVDSMYKYIGQKASTDPKYKKIFETKVYNLLQDDTLGWITSPAETYMPHMHASTFLMRDGKDGRPADTLFTFTGLNEMPSTIKLESRKVLTHDEAVEFGFNYDAAFAKFKSDPAGNYHKLSKAHQDLFDEYARTIETLRGHLTGVFKTRVNELYSMTANPSADASKIASPANLFVFENKLADKMIYLAVQKRNASTVGSSHYNAMSELITRLEDAEALSRLNLPHENSVTILEDIRTRFVDDKVKVLTKNFQKTLQFIMARIPAQGKQSFIHAKIKNFIFSSKNSVYGPLELILIAGLDYDIDKQNMMTWGLDDEGNVVDWTQYMIGGKINAKTLNDKIDEHAAIIKESFDRDKERLESRLAKIVEKLSGEIESVPALNALTKDKITAQNQIAALDAKLVAALEKAEEADRIMFTKAGQNFIVHNLLETIGNPKNAIEANTPVSTWKVAEAKIQPDIEALFKGKIGLEDLFISQQITSNANPYSTIQYEKINMNGKSGVGIYAADLKAYLAAFYATRMASEDVVDANGNIITKGENAHARLKSDLPMFSKEINDKFGIKHDALQFFKANGEVVTMPYIANATRWSREGKKISGDGLKALATLKSIDPADEAGQYELLLQFAETVGIMNSMNVEEQAWEDLSQLLTAATDNAKELILGKIGANNTTNSLISTMVRMGVDLSDVIPLINSKEIAEIVKEIERGGDLNIQDAENKKLALQGIVLEEAFNSRLAERLLAAMPQVPSDTNKIQDYLTNPVRVLYTYAKIAAEFSSLTRLLGINQGLKNSAYEVHAYVTGINDSINKAISDYNDTHEGAEITMKFDLQDFVANVSNKKTAKVNELLDAMDKIRTGINVPFILLKNAHYFSYFKALFQAENIRNRLSFTNQYVGNIIEAAKEKYKKKSQVMTKQVYQKISDTIYDFGILSFLEGKSIVLDGAIYDLSKPIVDEKSFGRTELLKHLPDILQGITGNYFVDSLKHNQVEIDPMTGVNVPILKGKDLGTIDSMEYARLAKGLRLLKTDYPSVYEALFYYSLITTKGGFAGGSFAGLFDISEYLKFSEFLKNNLKDIKYNVNAHKELIFLLNPLLLPQVTTIAPPAKSTYDVLLDQEDMAGVLDIGLSIEDELGTDLGGNSSVSWKSLNKEKFRLDHLNDEKNKKHTKLESDFFRSKSNNMTYQFDDTLGIWVPLTSDIPNLAIRSKLIDPLQDYVSITEEGGFTQGFTISLPIVMNSTKADGKNIHVFNNGTVVGYVTNLMKSDATDYAEKLINDPAHAKTKLKPKMHEILRSEESRDHKKEIYIVKTDSGEYMTFTAKALGDQNPGFIFEEGFIAASSKILDNSEVKGPAKTRIYSKGSSYVREIAMGEDKNEYQAHDVVIKYQAHDSSPVQFYNQELITKMIVNVDKNNVVDRHSLDFVNTQFGNYVNELIDRLLVLANRESIPTIEDAARIRLAGNSAGQILAPLVVRIASRVKSELGGLNPSLVAKIKVLQKGDAGFIELLYNLQGGGKEIPGGMPDIDYLSTKNVPKAALEFISNKTAKNDITQLSLGAFRDLTRILKVDSSLFDQFVTGTYLPESGVDIVTRQDGVIYARTGFKISASKQLATIEDKIVKGKPVYLPSTMRYEYSRPASKSILYSMVTFLNSRLPGVKWKILTSEQIKETYGTKYMTDKGFFKADGEIIINSDKATLETPLHEFGHVYLQFLMEEDMEEYQRLMKMSKAHVLYKRLGKTYKGLSSIDRSEEVFCELLSMAATNKIVANKGGITEQIIDSVSDTSGKFGKIVKKLTDWIQSMFAKAGLKRATAGISTDIELSLSDSLGSVIDNLSDEILFGNESILNKFSEETKYQVRKSRAGATLTIKEARDILVARGYIEWYCVS